MRLLELNLLLVLLTAVQVLAAIAATGVYSVGLRDINTISRWSGKGKGKISPLMYRGGLKSKPTKPGLKSKSTRRLPAYRHHPLGG